VYWRTYELAIGRGHVGLVRYLYEKNIHPVGLNPRWLQRTLLAAVECSSRALANFALELGANIKEPGLLETAIRHCNPLMTSLLFEKGAELTYSIVKDVDLGIRSLLCNHPLSESEKYRIWTLSKYRKGEQILTYYSVLRELEEWEHRYECKFGRSWPLGGFIALLQHVQQDSGRGG
jgi:hypothetical protein